MRLGAWPLVGRGEELDLLDGLAGGGAGSVVVSGGIGVGKSRLVADFLHRVGSRGGRTVLMRATRSTATIPFGPFASWAPDRGHPPTDRLQVLRVIAGALLEGDGPVVVAVDDAHLLDEGSAALLLYLAAQTPAGVVATVRSGEQCPDAVVALWKEDLAELVTLHPLSEAETVDLLERVLRGRLEPGARRRLWTLTTGVPLYLREVVRTAVDEGVLARWDDQWRWDGELGGSGRLGELLGDRLDRLGAEERRVLEMVAVGEPLPLDLVAELDAGGALADAEHHGLVVVADEPAGYPTVRLAHPLYGEVLRTSVPVLTARAHQRALAAAAVKVGWQDRDPLRVASWWLESGAVPGPASVFVAGARQALALAEWELADRLGQAAEASGADAEATLVRAAALVQSGGWGEADELLAGLPAGALDGDHLAEHARLRAGSLAWSQGRPVAGRDVLVASAARLRGSVRARVLVDAAYIAVLACDPREADRLAVEAMNEAGCTTELRVQALAVAALAWVLQGRIVAALRAAEMAAPSLPLVVAVDRYPGNPGGLMVPVQCLALVFNGRLDDAAALAASRLELAGSDDGDDGARSLVTSVAGHVALFQGRLTAAQRYGREAVARTEPGPASQWPAAVLASAAAQLGETTTAALALERAATTGPPIPLYTHGLTLARSWLLASRGDLPAARAKAEAVAADAARAAVWLLEMLALVDVARLGAPERVAARLTELGSAIDGPYARVLAAYARASADGDGDGLDDASARLDGMGALLLAAEAAAGAASAHLAAGRRDRHLRSLARARALVAGCGGARTPALVVVDTDPVLATLTRREREVVDLAASGLNNRQIAGRLYVSIRTVNAHLRQAYAKLGTNDRHQLAALLPATVAHPQADI